MRLSHLVLAIALINVDGLCQSVPGTNGKNQGNILSKNRCIAKGGVGIVNTHLYIDLTTAKNELILGHGNRWVGQSSATSESVFFFDNRVLSPLALPPEFNLSKAIVVSFEVDVVRFFDFGKMSGGYYKRPKA